MPSGARPGGAAGGALAVRSVRPPEGEPPANTPQKGMRLRSDRGCRPGPEPGSAIVTRFLTAAVLFALVAAPLPAATAAQAAPAARKVACGAKGASPHKSRGQEKQYGRKVIIAKATAVCAGNRPVSKLVIDTKLQKKTRGTWRNATRNRPQPYTPVKLGKKYVAWTHYTKCQKGTYRIMFRVSGKVDGKMRYGNWGAGDPRKNPCD
ncbi:hypothetical protein SSCG_04806 [Streptomyces clavuligerus]|nr:hypothetical protein SSCG_04806 [Streptomyces clavuligerus]